MAVWLILYGSCRLTHLVISVWLWYLYTVWESCHGCVTDTLWELQTRSRCHVISVWLWYFYTVWELQTCLPCHVVAVILLFSMGVAYLLALCFVMSVWLWYFLSYSMGVADLLVLYYVISVWLWYIYSKGIADLLTLSCHICVAVIHLQ